MCNVCVATNLINGKASSLHSIFSGNNYFITAEGEGAEFQPARFRLQKNDEGWSDWIETDDLASEAGKFGFDVKESSRTKEMDREIESHLTNS